MSRYVRRHYIAALVIAVLAVTTGVVVITTRNGSAKPAAAPSPSLPVPISAAPRQPVLGPLSTTAPQPLPASVAAILGKAANPLAVGGQLVGRVVDAQTGSVLWQRGGGVMSAPASTTKLLTAAAALQTLGPDYRFVTAARRVGHVIYLIGGGDPTILRTAGAPAVPPYPAPATLEALAQQTAASLPKQGRYTLRLDSSKWTSPALPVGWSNIYLTEGDVTPPSALELDEGRLQPADLDSPRTPTPVGQAGVAFAALLSHDGVRLRGHITQQQTPATATTLGQVSSPPLSELVQRMLTVSDNDLAEALGRAVAIKLHEPATFAGAAAAVTRTVGMLGVPRRFVALHDTSGLSHDDRVAPAALTDVLQAVISASNPSLRSIIEGLPVAGLTGTLSDRYRTRATRLAAGIARAKTGSLTGINTLAGLVVDHSGRLLIYSLLASQAPSPQRTVNALDRLVARLATCGCDVAS